MKASVEIVELTGDVELLEYATPPRLPGTVI
jgi:hypothetical protein